MCFENAGSNKLVSICVRRVPGAVPVPGSASVDVAFALLSFWIAMTDAANISNSRTIVRCLRAVSSVAPDAIKAWSSARTLSNRSFSFATTRASKDRASDKAEQSESDAAGDTLKAAVPMSTPNWAVRSLSAALFPCAFSALSSTSAVCGEAARQRPRKNDATLSHSEERAPACSCKKTNKKA